MPKTKNVMDSSSRLFFFKIKGVPRHCPLRQHCLFVVVVVIFVCERSAGNQTVVQSRQSSTFPVLDSVLLL